MIPAGYLLKRFPPPPAYLADAHVTRVCSVAHCVDDDVVDVQAVWQHNGFGLANDPTSLMSLAKEKDADLSDASLFYYEAYEAEIESDGWTFERSQWRPTSGLPSAQVQTAVVQPPPSTLRLIGYDVVVSEDFLEHSPLACNSVATQASVNDACLFDTLQAAREAIDCGVFGGGCEPGVYRIYSVSLVTSHAGEA